MKLSNGETIKRFQVASSREDAWIETLFVGWTALRDMSRPPARTRGLKLMGNLTRNPEIVASSREDAWIETGQQYDYRQECEVASSREDAWIETVAAEGPRR